MFAAHFATHRIAWSRALIAAALLVVLFGSPPRVMLGWPAVLSDLAGYALLVAAALWRIWCTAFIGGTKDGELAATGPYSVVRNPLYVGNFVGAVGFGLAVAQPWLAAAFAVAFAVLYPSVVANEEARLESIFGERYRRYRDSVPRWIPAWSRYSEPERMQISVRHLRKGILDAMWFLWAYAGWILIQQLKASGMLPTLF